MGRGRQKAKQTKVARKLKYYSPDTDLSALQRELASQSDSEYEDLYSKYADDTEEEEDDYVDPYAADDADADSEKFSEEFWTNPGK